MKVIIGAGKVQQKGWLALQENDLDVREFKNWKVFFKPESLDAILTEHTIEHLTGKEAYRFLTNARFFLKTGGYIRIACPDANNPNTIYQAMATPHSFVRRIMESFQTYAGHKEHYNIDTLSELLKNAGFKVKPLEYYKNGKRFVSEYSNTDGIIYRRYGSNYAEKHRILGFENTSLVVDAIK